jgi:hypothetical protein
MSEPTPANKSLITTNAHGAMMPSDHGQLYRMAEQLANSDLVPKSLKGKPADVFLVFQMGAELGLAQTQSLKSIHVINGIPAMSAETLGALVLGSGLCEDHAVRMTGEGDTLAVHVKVKRKGIATPHESSFSIAEAKKAGVTSNPSWSKWPIDMLTARAKSRSYRIMFPDVIKGVMAYEEAIDIPRTASSVSQFSNFDSVSMKQDEPSPALRKKVEPIPEEESVPPGNSPPSFVNQ